MVTVHASVGVDAFHSVPVRDATGTEQRIPPCQNCESEPSDSYSQNFTQYSANCSLWPFNWQEKWRKDFQVFFCENGFYQVCTDVVLTGCGIPQQAADCSGSCVPQ